jgi:hypothetical protein
MGSTPRSRTLGTSASKVPNVGTSRSFVCNGSILPTGPCMPAVRLQMADDPSTGARSVAIGRPTANGKIFGIEMPASEHI